MLILKRNAVRDYLDFVALADHIGPRALIAALRLFDRLYPQQNQESALQQLQIQLAQPIPYDARTVGMNSPTAKPLTRLSRGFLSSRRELPGSPSPASDCFMLCGHAAIAKNRAAIDQQTGLLCPLLYPSGEKARRR